jgi:glycosyltransferase involved in cell wall biosynthesis
LLSVTGALTAYEWEFLFIDNASGDATVDVVKRLAAADRRVKLIVNNRNYGALRSHAHAMLQATGDAVVFMAADFQDPPALLPELVARWQQGFPIVAAVKPESREAPLMFMLRRLYYATVGTIADVPLIRNFPGFGLYDRKVVEEIRKLNDPYPYIRGLIAELGFACAQVPYVQPRRERGLTKNNFYTLYDTAMLGITSHSKVPLRLATMAGFLLSFLSLLVAVGYFVAKLLYWDSFSLGVAPAVVGLFFFASVQLFFIGILGEYIGAIHTQVLRRPLVVEKERINLDRPSGGAD